MSVRKPTYDAGIRMISMVRALEERASRSMSVAAMAERLGVDARSIRRYSQAMSESLTTSVGEPLLTLETRNGEPWLRLAREESASARGVLYQYASLRAATRWLTCGQGTVLGDMADKQLEELATGLDRRVAPLLNRLATAFHYVPFGAKDHRVNEDVIEELLRAVIYGRPVDVRRTRRDGAEVRERLEPFTLVMYRDGLYLLARRAGHDEGALRTYALERFHEVEVDRTATFELPAGFDPAQCFEGRLGLWEPTGSPVRIELAFTAGAADVLSARRWPGFVAWRDSDDGRRVLVLDLPLSPELLSWVVSWGPQVEVLGPIELRAQVVAELASALELYQY